MSSNKAVREQLEKEYGKKCMIHEGIRTLKRPKPKKTRYKGKSIANQLTMHHLIPRSKNGPTTVENGCVCCRMCHDWLEQLPESDREKVNDELREYKRKFKLGVAELTTEGIKQVQEIELPEIEEDCIEIDLEPMTEEDLIKYEEYKRKRNERVFRKFEGFER